MLKLAKKIKKGKPADCTFDKTFENQKLGIEMLMCCNMNKRDYLIGPEVGVDQCVIVHPTAPHYLFNPHLKTETYVLPEDRDTELSREVFYYADYMGREVIYNDPPDYLLEALERLHAN